MSKQHNYRELRSCANCRHVFVRQECDGGDELYCTHEAPPRPPCMSMFMGVDEYPHEILSDEATMARAAWYEWADRRQCHPHGTCDAYEVKR